MTWFVVFLLFLTHFSESQTSHQVPKSCGAESIPFEMVVDLNGRPEINCGVPVCFGRTEANLDSDTKKIISKKEDGASDRFAGCTGIFSEAVCGSNNEWTGGVMEYSNGTHISLKMECCVYEGLNYATSLASISLIAGQRYKGGTVLENGKPVAFDLIKEVRKNVTEHNEAIYLISVYRMACIPDPPEMRNKVGNDVEKNMQYHTDRYAAGISPNGHDNEFFDEYEYLRSFRYPSELRHFPPYRMAYGNQIRRRQGSYYPRRWQFYRPIFDDYDYYEFEPVPIVRRPAFKRIGKNHRGRPLSFVHKGKSRVYADNDNYNENTEPLEEFIESTQAPAYDTDAKSPLPVADSYFSTNPTPTPLRETTPATLIQPPGDLPGYSQVNSYIQPLPLPPPPDTQQSLGSYITSPDANAQSNIYQQQQQYQPAYQPANQQPAYQPAYQSADSNAQSSYAASPDLNGVFSSLQCFSGDMIVQTMEGPKRMDKIEIGDNILSIEGNLISYSPVVMFLHKQPQEEALYTVIQTIDGHSIKLTEFHLIYISQCGLNENLKLVHAKDVTTNNCVHTVSSHDPSLLYSSKVLKITKKFEKGIYAPLTASGDLMVNNVLASCHSNVGVQTLQHTFFTLYRKLTRYIKSFGSIIGLNALKPDYDDLPFGVQYMTTVMDILLPKTLFTDSFNY